MEILDYDQQSLTRKTGDTSDHFNDYYRSNDVTRNEEIIVKEGTKLRFSLSS